MPTDPVSAGRYKLIHIQRPHGRCAAYLSIWRDVRSRRHNRHSSIAAIVQLSVYRPLGGMWCKWFQPRLVSCGLYHANIARRVPAIDNVWVIGGNGCTTIRIILALS